MFPVTQKQFATVYGGWNPSQKKSEIAGNVVDHRPVETVSRQGISWRSVGEDRDGAVDMVSFKHLVPVHEGIWSNYVAFVRTFLGDENPCTGRSLAHEPAVVGISLVNEGPLDNRPPSWYAKWPQWRDEWGAWIATKKAIDPARWGDIPDAFPNSGTYDSSPATAAFLVFLQEMEARFARRTRTFLRDELGCRAPLTNMNNGTRRAFQLVGHAAYDYVDTHFYIDHPVFLGRAWRPPQQFPNENPFKSPTLGGLTIAPLRFFDRPFTVSEWNYCGPGRYRGMGGIATGAEAALQDWSALWRFAWTHGVAGVTQPETKGVGSFDIANDPLQRASDLACVLLFLRGDIAPLQDEFPIDFDRASLDGEPLERSSRILVAHLTDVQPRGALYADEARTILLAWGAPQPLVMRRGRADISLRRSDDSGATPPSFTVYVLAPDGTRRGTIPATYSGGILSFVADIARDAASATFLYEIVSLGTPRVE